MLPLDRLECTESAAQCRRTRNDGALQPPTPRTYTSLGSLRFCKGSPDGGLGLSIMCRVVSRAGPVGRPGSYGPVAVGSGPRRKQTTAILYYTSPLNITSTIAARRELCCSPLPDDPMAVSPPAARALILSFAFLLFLNLRPISPSAVGSDPGAPGCAGDYYQEKFRRRASPEKRLPARQGSPFKIALFADLHFGEDAWTDWGPRQDVNYVQVMSTVLDDEVPGDCSFRGTQRLQLMKNEIEQNALSYSSKGPEDLWPSISNYVFQISTTDNPQSPVAYLYFLDSGDGSYPEVTSNAQSEWFNNRSLQINPDSRVPELIFWHIPSKAYEKVAPWIGVRKPCVGSINKETVASQEAEAGIMEILEKRPSVKAVFVGHNHGLDWCCPYRKLWLCFARHTGYGGYGNWARGARIIEINQHPFSIKSWIRMENHDVHSEVDLSS
ncbi:hypothetical protein NL676_016957 [Syzygium grande]|nr:hypothetical protein NL676_016957 [Syzygium grande]